MVSPSKHHLSAPRCKRTELLRRVHCTFNCALLVTVLRHGSLCRSRRVKDRMHGDVHLDIDRNNWRACQGFTGWRNCLLRHNLVCCRSACQRRARRGNIGLWSWLLLIRIISHNGVVSSGGGLLGLRPRFPLRTPQRFTWSARWHGSEQAR